MSAARVHSSLSRPHRNRTPRRFRPFYGGHSSPYHPLKSLNRFFRFGDFSFFLCRAFCARARRRVRKPSLHRRPEETTARAAAFGQAARAGDWRAKTVLTSHIPVAFPIKWCAFSTNFLFFVYRICDKMGIFPVHRCYHHPKMRTALCVRCTIHSSILS